MTEFRLQTATPSRAAGCFPAIRALLAAGIFLAGMLASAQATGLPYCAPPWSSPITCYGWPNKPQLCMQNGTECISPESVERWASEPIPDRAPGSEGGTGTVSGTVENLAVYGNSPGRTVPVCSTQALMCARDGVPISCCDLTAPAEDDLHRADELCKMYAGVPAGTTTCGNGDACFWADQKDFDDACAKIGAKLATEHAAEAKRKSDANAKRRAEDLEFIKRQAK